MNRSNSNRLLVCYVPGLDVRRITAKQTPYLHGLMASHPSAYLRSFPNTDMVPTLITGVYPQDHGVWQVKLQSGGTCGGRGSWLHRLPDVITTTVQGFLHLADHSFDLATIPPRRLERFEVKRFKYTRQYFPSIKEAILRRLTGAGKGSGAISMEELARVGGVPSIFEALEASRCGFVFNRKFGELDRDMSRLFQGDHRLEFFELHSLDIVEHWNLQDPELTARVYRGADEAIRRLHRECRAQKIGMVVLSDHGQEPVRDGVDIRARLAGLGLRESDYSYYLEAPMARFWFHSDRARRLILDSLSELSMGAVLSNEELRRYGLDFSDSSYGEAYFVANPGTVIFPHDFYQPLANLFLGLSEWQQRPRLSDARLRGSHGYLPHHDCERGFIISLNSGEAGPVSDEASVIDVAPSILGLLGVDAPSHMVGCSLFTETSKARP